MSDNFDVDFIPLPDSPPPVAASSISLPQGIPPPEEIPPPPLPPPEEAQPSPSTRSSAARARSPPARDDLPSKDRKKFKPSLSSASGTGDVEYSIKDDEQELMARMLGFSSFNSTKGKKVPGNDVGGVQVLKKRRYRQYMNRKGGFNRPLDKVP